MEPGDVFGNWTVEKILDIGKRIDKTDKSKKVCIARCVCGAQRRMGINNVADAKCYNCGDLDPVKAHTLHALDTCFALLQKSIPWLTREVMEHDKTQMAVMLRKMVIHLMVESGISFMQIGKAMNWAHTSISRAYKDGDKASVAIVLAQLVNSEDRRQLKAEEEVKPLRLADFKPVSREAVRGLHDQLKNMRIPKVEDFDNGIAVVESHREIFKRVCETVPKLAARDAERLWKDTCKTLWPHTWEKQYQQPPGGHLIGAQEVLAL